MGIPQQFRPIQSLPMQAPAAPPATASGQPSYEGGDKKKRVEKESARSFSILDQLMSALGAFDAFGNSLAARRDPTMPALINSQLGNYANFQNQGGTNANQMLSGDFSGNNFMQPVNFGGTGGGPFDIPYQRPGGNPLTEALFNQIVSPAATGQISQIGQTLAGFGSPNTNRTSPYGGTDIAALFAALGVPMPGGQQPVLGSFATGTPFVPQTGPYQLHQGEAVIPAQQNPAAQGANPIVAQSLMQPQAVNWKGNLGYQGAGGPAPTVSRPVPQPVAAPPQPPLQPPMSPLPPTATEPYPAPPGGVPPAVNPATAQQTMPPPQTGPANPLQQALQQLQTMLGSGGPISPEVQNIQNQQMADMVGSNQSYLLDEMRGRLGGRGLGGSGIQFGLEQAINDAAMQQQVQGRNQVGLNAANNNWGALQGVANSLIGGSLGAGQFGLQQAAFNQNQSMSMFEQLMNAIRQSYTPAATPAA